MKSIRTPFLATVSLMFSMLTAQPIINRNDSLMSDLMKPDTKIDDLLPNKDLYRICAAADEIKRYDELEPDDSYNESEFEGFAMVLIEAVYHCKLELELTDQERYCLKHKICKEETDTIKVFRNYITEKRAYVHSRSGDLLYEVIESDEFAPLDIDNSKLFKEIKKTFSESGKYYQFIVLIAAAKHISENKNKIMEAFGKINKVITDLILKKMKFDREKKDILTYKESGKFYRILGAHETIDLL